jgi:hypothetical protein
MQIRLLLYVIFFVFLLAGSDLLFAQNNVGIGTKKPDLTAILEISDTGRGLLLPRTDTASIQAYVNSLSPNPGIQHGLTIFETNMRTIYVYNGIKQKWQPISSLKGPKGITGPTGPTGPRGERGIATQWRDSAILPPIKRWPHPDKIPFYFETLGDTCGDFYHQTMQGFIWSYDCINHEWMGPLARWRNFGVPMFQKIQATGLLEEPMPTSSAGNVLKVIPGLSYTILVPPDTVAYLWITTEGNVQKKYVNYHDINKMAFDFFMVDTNGSTSYLNHQQTITIGRNIKIPLTTTSQFDKTPWEISMAATLEGKISAPGNPLPATDYLQWTFETHYGQFFMTGNSTHPDSSRVIVLDNAGSASNQFENYAVMNVYIVFERSRNAPWPY